MAEGIKFDTSAKFGAEGTRSTSYKNNCVWVTIPRHYSFSILHEKHQPLCSIYEDVAQSKLEDTNQNTQCVSPPFCRTDVKRVKYIIPLYVSMKTI
jgi:hypothetical protein